MANTYFCTKFCQTNVEAYNSIPDVGNGGMCLCRNWRTAFSAQQDLSWLLLFPHGAGRQRADARNQQQQSEKQQQEQFMTSIVEAARENGISPEALISNMRQLQQEQQKTLQQQVNMLQQQKQQPILRIIFSYRFF